MTHLIFDNEIMQATDILPILFESVFLGSQTLFNEIN